MKMADVRVGMRLRLRTDICGDDRPITVTEITERGFKYSYDEERSLIPRLGLRTAKDGHEHFGLDGDSLYEPVDPSKEPV